MSAHIIVPCPFCGSKDVATTDDNTGIVCNDCGEFSPNEYVFWYLGEEEKENEHNPS